MPGESGVKCVAKMTIRVFSDGRCKVEGIPSSFAGAMEVCKMANAAVAERFIVAAQQNQLDDTMTINPSKIVTVPAGAIQ